MWKRGIFLWHGRQWLRPVFYVLLSFFFCSLMFFLSLSFLAILSFQVLQILRFGTKDFLLWKMLNVTRFLVSIERTFMNYFICFLEHFWKGSEQQQNLHVVVYSSNNKKCRRRISKHTWSRDVRMNASTACERILDDIYGMERLVLKLCFGKRKDVRKNNDNSEKCLS